MQKQYFKNLDTFISQLNESNSSKAKEILIRTWGSKDEFIKKILYYTYNPYYKFHVTSDNLLKVKGTNKDAALCNDIFDLLDLLRKRRITGHAAVASVNYFIGTIASNDYNAIDLVHKIIDKDFKIRAGVKIINKAFPNFIPEFEIALAYKYQEYEGKVDFNNEEWFCSHKLDGVRCVTIIDKDGNPRFWSREGNEFFTLGNLIPEIKQLGLVNKVLDGEACIMNGENEDFKLIHKEIGKKNHTIQNPKYFLFDMIDLEEFENQSSNIILEQRLAKLEYVLGNKQYKTLTQLEQIPIKSLKHFEDMFAEGTKKGWEGIIIRRNVGYEGKRSKNMLKMKKFFDDEFIVKRTINEKLQYINPNTGLNEEAMMLSKVIIEYKGYEVGVGSGFTLEERFYYYEHPEEIIKKQITVKHGGESSNDDGGLSLRWPVLKTIYQTKRNY